MRRDQVIRYLDLAAYHYLNHPNSVNPPPASSSLLWTSAVCYEALRPQGWASRQGIIIHMVPLDPAYLPTAGRQGRACGARPGQKGWAGLSWKQLKGILKIGRGEFKTQAEKRFVDDLITYS